MLQKTLGLRLPSPMPTLLLYLLVHRSLAFRDHVIASDQAGALVLPLLERLYQPKPQGPELNDTYMQLVVLLMLTQDPRFSAKVEGERER